MLILLCDKLKTFVSSKNIKVDYFDPFRMSKKWFTFKMFDYSIPNGCLNKTELFPKMFKLIGVKLTLESRVLFEASWILDITRTNIFISQSVGEGDNKTVC